jgi:voltage-gated potassium channel Kch
VQSVARKQPNITPFPSISSTLETNRTFLNNSKSRERYVKIPKIKIKIYSLVIFEIICFVYFTIDFILRITTCPSVKFYFLSIINITDALALFGMITNLVMISIYEQEKYKESWTDLLEYTQTLRALRLFRIVSGLKAGRVLAYTVRANYKELFVLVVFLVAGMCTFASVLFITEDKQNVKTIPVAWYWVIVTMTTVGYGDMVPETFIGRLVCCLCAISGVLLFALIVPIFANNYLTLYQFAGHNKELDEYDTLEIDKEICLEISKDNTDHGEMSRGNEKNKEANKRLLLKEN